MTYDYKSRKIVCLVADNLETWQAMNAVGHMAVSLGANKDSELMGKSTLTDASGVSHLGIARFGFIIKKAPSEKIGEILRTARNNKEVTIIDFPREMLDTGHDDELVEWMNKKDEKDFEYLGALLYGPSETLNILTKGIPLWS